MNIPVDDLNVLNATEIGFWHRDEKPISVVFCSFRSSTERFMARDFSNNYCEINFTVLYR